MCVQHSMSSYRSLGLISERCLRQCQVTTPGWCPTLVWVYIAAEHAPCKPHSVILILVVVMKSLFVSPVAGLRQGARGPH